MMNVREFRIFADNFCLQGDVQEEYSRLPEIIKLLRNSSCHSVSCIESFGFLLSNVLKKAILTKQVSVLPGNCSKIEYNEDLMNFHEEALEILRNIVSKSSNEEFQVTSLKALFSLLPIQSKFGENSKFPIKQFSLDISCIVMAEENISSLLSILEPYMSYQDIAASMWEALRTALTLDSLRPLKPNHIKNISSIINLNPSKIDDLNKTLCGQKCKYNKKKIGIIVRAVWEQLAFVNLQDEIQQKLSLTLIEHIMPIIDKPVTLTDYFMSCLNRKGPNGLIALQGIFNLIQKFNINYPNVYNKLYNMFDADIFDTPYKARFYYLSDIFLSSLCLSEGMVAGFIKRFSRLSLVAPPEDIVILMAFITNLLIRHPTLKYLINSATYETVESDPYDYSETDPTKSNACQSSLWEVKLLQEHVLPNVSAAAMFINEPLPSTERNLANLLETTSDLIFARECKKKLKTEIPVNFEKPVSLGHYRGPSAFNFWNIVN